MTYQIEYYADYNDRGHAKVYGDCHGVIEIEADDMPDAEERVGARLRDLFGQAWTITGAVGISAYCLHC